METGGFVSVKLPFTLKIDFVADKNKHLDKNVWTKILNEISDITPTPKLTVTIRNKEQYNHACKDFQHCNTDITYQLYYAENTILNADNINLILPLNTPNLYKIVKKLCNNNKIILIPTTGMKSADLEDLELIKQDFSLNNIYLQPYLTDKEIDNFSKKILNREFLTCAAPWLNPIIDGEGNVYCCAFNNIGNIKENSLLEIWNNSKAEDFRNILVNNKNCNNCKKCLKKYEDSFLVVDNAEINYKNKLYRFPSVLNYVPSSPKTAVLENYTTENTAVCEPYPIYGNIENVEQSVKDKIVLLLE